MQSIMQGKVTGAKMNKGSFTPDGETVAKAFDYTQIFVEAKLRGDGAKEKGYASQPYKWGNSENYGKIKHLEFPFVAEIHVEHVTDGKGGSELQVVDVKPVSRAKAA